MVKVTDWAYLAGFIEGEGCISAYPTNQGRTYAPTIRLTQVNPMIPDLVELFGVGKVYLRAAKPPKQARHIWVIMRREEVEWILRGVKPFLRGKRLQALVALKLLEVQNQPLEERQKWARILRQLKHE